MVWWNLCCRHWNSEIRNNPDPEYKPFLTCAGHCASHFNMCNWHCMAHEKHFAIISFSESGKIEGSFHFRIVYGHKYH